MNEQFDLINRRDSNRYNKIKLLVELRVMEYLIFPKAPWLEPHHQEHLFGDLLPISRDAVGVFYSPGLMSR